MPFDRLDFRETPPEPSQKGPGEKRMVLLFVLGIAIPALLSPISLAAFVDLINFLLGRGS
jgi:hypothetical protein